MPASHTSSQHNHAGSSSSKAAEKHPSDGKACRESRLERFKNDNEDNLFPRLHDAQPTSQNLEELDQDLEKLT